MNTFPSSIKFKYNWRTYQERVLNELQHHLEDNHLHVVAPPGSGKTILGLEVMLRLNKPSLILAPSIAIKNQWIQKFTNLFLASDKAPEWISNDIYNPAFLTIITYQGLHAAFTNKEGENKKAVIQSLTKIKVGTIVIDEAHHLQNAWWKSLTELKNAVTPTIVGLTATPPYDVSLSEWNRYLSLNGPIDAEITVPELIKEKDLCPHQDYIYFSLPSENETVSIRKFIDDKELLFNTLSTFPELVNTLSSHSVFMKPKLQLEWIYENIEVYSSLLIFLHHNEIEISKIHLDVIGDRKLKIPKLNEHWIDVLLNYIIKDEGMFLIPDSNLIKRLYSMLAKGKVIEFKRVSFSENTTLNSLIASSANKLASIVEITRFENKCLKNELRLVILTDFIRKEFLTKGISNNIELNKVGVISIFEALRRQIDHLKTGVLTGSIIIIPKSAKEVLDKTTTGAGLGIISTAQLPFDSNFLYVRPDGKQRTRIVSMITLLFNQGEINVLIGTKSLLGEGWDAPCINSLILASFVGSFVLSNQMRGRAIRKDIANTSKTGNIWHLACINPYENYGGSDFQLMQRRFKSFLGLSITEEPLITNTLNRLEIPSTHSLHSPRNIDLFNQQTFLRASQRDLLQERWDRALKNGVQVISEVKIPYRENKPYTGVKQLYINKTIANMISALLAGVSTYNLEVIMKGLRNVRSAKDLYTILIMAGAGTTFVFGSFGYRTIKLYLKYRDIGKDIAKIGEAIVDTLYYKKVFTTPKNEVSVFTSHDESGAVFCHLDGGSAFEKALFVQCIDEIISPIDNPKHIMVRRGLTDWGRFQKDYHSVPEIISKGSGNAEYFKARWNYHVGNCSLHHTRSIEGRKILIKAKMGALSRQFDRKIEKVNVWK